MRKLSPEEFNPFYKTYVDLVEDVDFLHTLKKNTEVTLTWINQFTDQQWNYRYADGKWTVKEVLLHLIDAERVFAYRALRIGRGDKTPLSGFSQNDYVPASKPDNRSVASIIHEYQTVRNATISLFENMDQEMLDQLGETSGSRTSTLAIAHIIVGHEIHHSNILRERYDL